MIKHTYTVDNNNAVSIFIEGQEDPTIFQPTWPDGTPWANEAEATSWAEVYISSLEDPDYNFTVGYSPDEPTREKPAAPEVLAAPAE
jgi:hypothetical protein